MKKNEIIKSKKDFNTLIKQSKFIKNDYYVLYYSISNKYKDNKYGIAVAKKIGNAVVRNKLKRQIRSIIDQNKKLFPKSGEYIIMLRKEVLVIKYNQMTDNLLKLIEKVNK